MICKNCDNEYNQEYCPVCDIRYLAEIPPWYYKNWFVFICLVLCFPVGIILTWKKPGWTISLKSIVTAVFTIFLAAMLVSFRQSSIGITDLHIELESNESGGYDIGLTVNANVERNPEKASLLGLIYYSNDEAVARFENGRVYTVGEGSTEIYVSDKNKGVFSNKIVVEVVDKEAEWIALEASRTAQAEEIEANINNIGEITIDSGDTINLARENYNIAEEQVQLLVTNYSMLEDAEQKYADIIENQEIDITEDDLSLTVYYTKTGTKYHYVNPCGSGTYYSCTLGEALEMDLDPCKKCVNYSNYLKLRSE